MADDLLALRRLHQISRERALTGVEVLTLIQAGERVVAELDRRKEQSTCPSTTNP
jgi:hypothetical protein